MSEEDTNGENSSERDRKPINRRNFVRSLGVAGGAVAFGGLGARTASAKSSEEIQQEFSQTELTQEDAQKVLHSLAKTDEFEQLQRSVRKQGFELDHGSLIAHRASYHDNARTMVSVPLRHDDNYRLIIGRDDTTGKVVVATLEQKTVSDAETKIELSQVPSLARESEFPTAASTNSDGLVPTTLIVEGKPGDISVSTGDGTPDVTPNGIYCFNCRFLAGLICDIGCAAGAAYLCGLASVLASFVGLAACLGITGAICRVIGFVGCGISSRQICCRAGGWCC